jgi:hypothetical protein
MKKPVLVCLVVLTCVTTSKSQKPSFGFNAGLTPQFFSSGQFHLKPAFGYQAGMLVRMNMPDFSGYRYANDAHWYVESGLNYMFGNRIQKVEMPAYAVVRKKVKHLRMQAHTRYVNSRAIMVVSRFGLVTSYQNQRQLHAPLTVNGEFLPDVTSQKNIHVQLAGGFGFEYASRPFTAGIGTSVHTGFVEGFTTNPAHPLNAPFNSMLGGTYLSIDAWVIKGKFKKIRRQPCGCML